MPTTSFSTTSSALPGRAKPSYGGTTYTAQTRPSRPLPAGPGPLDTAGLPLRRQPSPVVRTRPFRVDHTDHTITTYHPTTSRLFTDSWRTNTGTSDLNDRLPEIHGRRKSSVDSTPTTTYRSSYGLSSSDKKPGMTLTRRDSVTDRIEQFESTTRNPDKSYSPTALITDRTSSLSLTSSSPSSSQKDSCGLTGLRNLRNTCFMNSILQCLSNTKPLLEYCLKDSFNYDINDRTSHMKGQLIRAYASLMKEMWKKNGDSCVSPTSFKSSIAKFAPRFVGYSQQDSQEFLRYLLEGLHEDVNRVTSRPKLPIISEDEDAKINDKPLFYWERYLKLENSIIVDIFVGQLRSTLKCTYCNYESTTYDPFWDLSLPLPKSSSNVHLSDCMRLFTSEEELDGDEKPTCAKCKARRRCTKRFSIQRFPRVLVLHLKRFSGERFRSKLTTLVNFPVTDLDVSQFAANPDELPKRRYNLTGVSNHSGTVFSGHYTAYCKHPYREDWHEYNDQSVRSTPTRSVVTSEAYVLFYEMSDKKSHL